MASDPRIQMMGQQVDTATPLSALSRGIAEKQRYDQELAMKQQEMEYKRQLDQQQMALNQMKMDALNSTEEDKKAFQKEAVFFQGVKALKGDNTKLVEFLSDPRWADVESKDDIISAINSGDPTLLDNEIAMGDFMINNFGKEYGFEPAKAAENKILGAGQVLVDQNGNVIAEGKDKTLTGMTQVVDPTTGEITYVSTKPMPASITKLQDELIGDMSVAEGLKSDLNSAISGINSGAVDLGLISNAWSRFQNTGIVDSSPESRNAATLMATLQKMRNDSLRLNKGTQTEGDAQRAWAEILGKDEENPSLPKDNKLLVTALSRISSLNDRASQEKMIRIDTMRSEYDKGELDLSKIQDQKPSFTLEGNNSGWSVEEIK